MNGVTFWASVKVPSAGIEGAIVAGTGNVSPYFAARSGGTLLLPVFSWGSPAPTVGDSWSFAPPFTKVVAASGSPASLPQTGLILP